MNLLRPLLADVALAKVIVFVVVIAIYAIQHLLGGLKKAAAPQQAPRVPQPPRGDQEPRPADPAIPAQRQDVNAELNEFLRRAAAKRQEALGRTPTTAAPKPEPARPRKRKKSESAAAPSAADERLTQRRPLPKLETRIGDELKPSVGEKLGEQVREAFDRQLGQLGGAETSVPAEPQVPSPELQPTIASELTTLLSNPQSLRGAIILNEILTRPEHRW